MNVLRLSKLLFKLRYQMVYPSNEAVNRSGKDTGDRSQSKFPPKSILVYNKCEKIVEKT